MYPQAPRGATGTPGLKAPVRAAYTARSVHRLSAPLQASAPTPTAFWRRLARVAGPVALGTYTVIHVFQLWPMALGGADVFNATHALPRSLPWGLAWNLLLWPLVTAWMLDVLLTRWARQSTAERFPSRRNWVLAAQPYAVGVLAVFLFNHVLGMRWLPLWRGQAVDARWVHWAVDSFLMVDFHVAGVLSAAFCLPVAVWQALLAQGLVVRGPAQRRAALVLGLVGLFFGLLALHQVAAFHDARFVVP